MARTKIDVKQDILTSFLNKWDGKVATRKELFQLVAKEYSDNTQIAVTPATISQRIAEFGLLVKTPVGKRGRKAKVGPGTQKQENAIEATPDEQIVLNAIK